jgi:hypothetical protein
MLIKKREMKKCRSLKEFEAFFHRFVNVTDKKVVNEQLLKLISTSLALLLRTYDIICRGLGVYESVSLVRVTTVESFNLLLHLFARNSSTQKKNFNYRDTNTLEVHCCCRK